MFVGDDWLRERGYVLWDSSRLYSNNILEMFKDPPEERTHEESRVELDAMRYSWAERSKVWQQGGSGYWADGDLSKIVWAASAAGT